MTSHTSQLQAAVCGAPNSTSHQALQNLCAQAGQDQHLFSIYVHAPPDFPGETEIDKKKPESKTLQGLM